MTSFPDGGRSVCISGLIAPPQFQSSYFIEMSRRRSGPRSKILTRPGGALAPKEVLTRFCFTTSAARNLRRAGVDETVAMAITGHKTVSIFRRYNITDDRDLEQAIGCLGSYLEQKTSQRSKVISFAQTKGQ